MRVLHRLTDRFLLSPALLLVPPPLVPSLLEDARTALIVLMSERVKEEWRMQVCPSLLTADACQKEETEADAIGKMICLFLLLVFQAT